MANRLAQENSPYLLQHAHNPVDWYPWGEEALEKARTENKPIFLSIGYAACHWCHVMERESFEDPAVAEIMNRSFVSIKVDREQRPDLDSIYMAATVALTGRGGWPMSVFLTPGLRPFYAGTYYPPVQRYNMPSFQDVLRGVIHAWTKDTAEIERVAAEVAEHLRRRNKTADDDSILNLEMLDDAVRNLHAGCDRSFGGWGDAPKFPQAMAIDFLLRRGPAVGAGAASLDTADLGTTTPGTAVPGVAFHALKAMARGGMYDVVGGGFSRYSTDKRWLVPHFEKMLYDNALLARAYVHAWQLGADASDRQFYRRIAEESLDFVLRELTDPQGGFYSSLDADSEGEEGKFYVWDGADLERILGGHWDLFEAAYGIRAEGNWEGRTVLQRDLDDAGLGARFGLSTDQVAAALEECRRSLFAVREKRVRPGLDDKVLTAWNGLMLSAFAEAARAFEEPGESAAKQATYLRAAQRSADFLLGAMRPEGRLRRTWRAGKTSPAVFLEDYAALILGLLDLYGTDFDNRWFAAAEELAGEMIAAFGDPEGGFFDTPADGEVLLMRPKDLEDNAVPCGNSLAAEALLRLSALTGKADYRARSERAFGLVAEAAAEHPIAFARWLGAADFALAKVVQVAVVGDPAQDATQALLTVLRAAWRPNLVVASSPLPLPPDAPGLLAGRPCLNGKPTAYLCEGFVCRQPVDDPQALKELLDAAMARAAN